MPSPALATRPRNATLRSPWWTNPEVDRLQMRAFTRPSQHLRLLLWLLLKVVSPFDCVVDPILDWNGPLGPQKLIPDKYFCHFCIVHMLEVDIVKCLMHSIKAHFQYLKGCIIRQAARQRTSRNYSRKQDAWGRDIGPRRAALLVDDVQQLP